MIETIYSTPIHADAFAIFRRIRDAFPEAHDRLVVTADGECDPAPMFSVEIRGPRAAAALIREWLMTPRTIDALGAAYRRACVAYEVGVIDAPAFLTWMRENELA